MATDYLKLCLSDQALPRLVVKVHSGAPLEIFRITSKAKEITINRFGEVLFWVSRYLEVIPHNEWFFLKYFFKFLLNRLMYVIIFGYSLNFVLKCQSRAFL